MTLTGLIAHIMEIWSNGYPLLSLILLFNKNKQKWNHNNYVSYPGSSQFWHIFLPVWASKVFHFVSS